MINYSCDRCRCPLGTPMDINRHSSPTHLEAKQGCEVLMPVKTSVGYTFMFTHLCESCLGDLAAWKKAKMTYVDQSQVLDR